MMHTTGWRPDEQSNEDYDLSTQKIYTLIKQVQVYRGMMSFLNLLRTKENLSDETNQAIDYLKIQVKDLRNSYISNIDLVSARILPGLPNNEKPTYIASPLEEDIVGLVAEGLGLQKQWTVAKQLKQEYVTLSDAIDGSEVKEVEGVEEVEELKKKIEKVIAKISPIGAYFNFSDEEFQDFLKQDNFAEDRCHNFLFEEKENQQFKADLSNLFKEIKKKLPEITPLRQKIETFRMDLGRFYFSTAVKALNKENILASSSSDQDLSNPTRPSRILSTTLQSNAGGYSDSPLTIQMPLTYQLARKLTETNKPYTCILPETVDLSYWCSPVKDQGSINTCTINAIASLVEYFEKKSSGKSRPVSRRFLYKVTRRLAVDSETYYLGQISPDDLKAFAAEGKAQILKNCIDEVTSFSQPIAEDKLLEILQLVKTDKKDEFERKLFDIGASIRHTLKALQLFGVPPERYWLYDTEYPNIDEEPTSFCYSFAQNYQAIKYFRLDFFGEQGEESLSEEERQDRTLTQIRAVLAAGFPSVFGFPIKFTEEGEPDSEQIKDSGEICFLDDGWAEDIKDRLNDEEDTTVLGHAALAIGYDDHQDAFLIQNSWGKTWGNQGYGWLPYDYVRHQLATRWWSLMNLEWVETGRFGLNENLGSPTTENDP